LLDPLQDGHVSQGPPPATLARRARSYSDFYDVVRAHIRKEYHLAQDTHRKRARQHQIKTAVDFGAWYNGIKGELLDASHEEYQYASLPTANMVDTDPVRL
jgi:conserved oligomeric Golgi complex subunit 3